MGAHTIELVFARTRSKASSAEKYGLNERLAKAVSRPGRGLMVEGRYNLSRRKSKEMLQGEMIGYELEGNRGQQAKGESSARGLRVLEGERRADQIVPLRRRNVVPAGFNESFVINFVDCGLDPEWRSS